jgi:hypothetical protein
MITGLKKPNCRALAVARAQATEIGGVSLLPFSLSDLIVILF